MVLTRKHCIEIEPNVFVKDLRVIQGRNIEDIIMVDNFAHSYSLQLQNGVPVIPFYDNPVDDELFKLDHYLRSLHASS